VRIESSNYKGDWNAICQYCGKPQQAHQKVWGEKDEIQYVHREACVEQKHFLRKEAVKEGIALRTTLWFIDIGKYLWGLIPFKAEAKLAWSFIKNIFVSVRAMIYLLRNKGK
jgi:hypothetical protein